MTYKLGDKFTLDGREYTVIGSPYGGVNSTTEVRNEDSSYTHYLYLNDPSLGIEWIGNWQKGTLYIDADDDVFLYDPDHNNRLPWKCIIVATGSVSRPDHRYDTDYLSGPIRKMVPGDES